MHQALPARRVPRCLQEEGVSCFFARLCCSPGRRRARTCHAGAIAGCYAASGLSGRSRHACARQRHAEGGGRAQAAPARAWRAPSLPLPRRPAPLRTRAPSSAGAHAFERSSAAHERAGGRAGAGVWVTIHLQTQIYFRDSFTKNEKNIVSFLSLPLLASRRVARSPQLPPWCVRMRQGGWFTSAAGRRPWPVAARCRRAAPANPSRPKAVLVAPVENPHAAQRLERRRHLTWSYSEAEGGGIYAVTRDVLQKALFASP